MESNCHPWMTYEVTQESKCHPWMSCEIMHRVEKTSVDVLRRYKMTKRATIHPYGQRFGAIIRRLRTQRGMQIQQLARRADLTRQHLALLERGSNLPSLHTIFELAKVLQVK